MTAWRWVERQKNSALYATHLKRFVACNNYTVAYHHCELFLEEFVALKATDYVKYQKKMKKLCGTAFLILDDFLLHTLTDEREVRSYLRFWKSGAKSI